MKVIKELEEQYNDIDQRFAEKEFEAHVRGWYRKENLYHNKRRINDQAYFLFIFTRLEYRIREESSKLIYHKQNSLSRWKQRAPWDILPSSMYDNIPFKHRLALLTEKGGRKYDRVVSYYNERNSIAHGGNFINPISMISVITDIKRLYKTLKA